MIGALIGAGASLAGGLINAWQSRRNIRDTVGAQQHMAQYQYSKDLEMWNRQNQYNSPTEQMKRFSEAGLNPRLMYGKGSASAGQATEMPKYSAVRPDFSGRIPILTRFIDAYQNYQIKNEQIDLLREQNRIKDEEQSVKQIQAEFERAMWYRGVNKVAGAWADVNVENTLQWQHKMAQLRKYQADAATARHNEIMKGIDKDWYKWSKGLGLLKNIPVRGVGVFGKFGKFKAPSKGMMIQNYYKNAYLR